MNKKFSYVISRIATVAGMLMAFPCFSQVAKPHATKVVYQDKAYEQDYSIKYYPENATGLRTVVSDRNGNIQVLAGNSVLRTKAGRLLIPGTLATDRTYLPLLDRKVSAIDTYKEQIVYLDDKALFSNSWAGKLYIPHNMPGAHLLCAGYGGQFLISDGQQIALIKDSVLWSGLVSEGISEIRYEPARNLFWLLSTGSLSYFSPVNKKIVTVFHGEGLTCFTLSGKKILVGTHNGYQELQLPSCRPLGAIRRALPATDLTVIETIGDRVWFGSLNGAFMTSASAKAYSYFASERWMPGNRVVSISKGPDNSVLVLTDKGLGKICFQPMTLEQKASYYEAIVRQRHIRYGFYSDYSGIKNGDVSTATMGPHDSDNLWTSMYLAGELFRYLTTHEEEAKQNYRESFDAMERLFTLSGVCGLFGRCIERSGVVEFK
ncbi:MAG TPA: hypothetical protein VGM31_19260, partial [Puia sp.]